MDKNIFVRNMAYEIIRRRKWFRSKGEHRKRKIEIKRKSGKREKKKLNSDLRVMNFML